MDLALDSNGEIIIDAAGRAALVSEAAELAQAVGIRLRMQRGEWWGDITAGVPWLSLMGKGTTAGLIRAALAAEIRRVTRNGWVVAAVKSLIVAVDRATRTADVRWTATARAPSGGSFEISGEEDV